MKLQKSLLDSSEITYNINDIESYVSDDDVIYLEDESGRIKCSGDCLNPSKLLTGTIVCVLGSVRNSTFECKDICYPEPATIFPYPKIDNDNYILFTSGFSISDNSDIIPIDLLIQYLRGCITSVIPPQNIIHMVIAGNSLNIDGELFLNKQVKKDEKEKAIQPLKLLDTIISEVYYYLI